MSFSCLKHKHTHTHTNEIRVIMVMKNINKLNAIRVILYIEMKL